MSINPLKHILAIRAFGRGAPPTQCSQMDARSSRHHLCCSFFRRSRCCSFPLLHSASSATIILLSLSFLHASHSLDSFSDAPPQLRTRVPFPTSLFSSVPAASLCVCIKNTALKRNIAPTAASPALALSLSLTFLLELIFGFFPISTPIKNKTKPRYSYTTSRDTFALTPAFFLSVWHRAAFRCVSNPAHT